MYILIRMYLLFVCFINVDIQTYAVEDFEKFRKQSPFKVIDITIRNPAVYHGAGLCMSDDIGRVTLLPQINQIDNEILINIYMNNERVQKKERKTTMKVVSYSKDIPIKIDYLMCNSLNDYGNLVLRAYIDATQRLSARQSEFHQLYQGFYDLITSNEEGKIILKDIIDPVSRNIQTMRVLETAHSDAVPGLVKSLAIVPSLIEKSSVVPDNNASTPIDQSLSRSFPVHYLAHPIATGSLSFMIVDGIGYITTDPRSALVYATVGGIAAYILPQLYNYHAKYEAYSF